MISFCNLHQTICNQQSPAIHDYSELPNLQIYFKVFITKYQFSIIKKFNNQYIASGYMRCV